MSPLLVAVGLLVSAPPTLESFEKLKALEGNWKAGERDAAKFVSLRVISGGTAVLEMVTGADRTKVLSASVYSVEGGKLVVAFYGTAGTARLEAKGAGKLDFEGKGPLTSLTLSAKGDDKLIYESVSAAGKASLELSREYVDTLK